MPLAERLMQLYASESPNMVRRRRERRTGIREEVYRKHKLYLYNVSWFKCNDCSKLGKSMSFPIFEQSPNLTQVTINPKESS